MSRSQMSSSFNLQPVESLEMKEEETIGELERTRRQTTGSLLNRFPLIAVDGWYKDPSTDCLSFVEAHLPVS